VQNQQAAGAQVPNQQQVVNGALVRRICGSQPPKFTADGGFDLYRAQIEGYLIQRGCWDVVDDSAAADPADPQWVERNQFACCALLIGFVTGLPSRHPMMRGDGRNGRMDGSMDGRMGVRSTVLRTTPGEQQALCGGGLLKYPRRATGTQGPAES